MCITLFLSSNEKSTIHFFCLSGMEILQVFKYTNERNEGIEMQIKGMSMGLHRWRDIKSS